MEDSRMQIDSSPVRSFYSDTTTQDTTMISNRLPLRSHGAIHEPKYAVPYVVHRDLGKKHHQHIMQKLLRLPALTANFPRFFHAVNHHLT